MDETSGLAPEGGQPTIVDSWLEPLGDPPCGEDLEWDNDVLAMTQAAAGKPAKEFADDKAVPPDWVAVKRIAEGLFDRTRDLRVAVQWARAQLYRESAVSLPDSLRLVHGLLVNFWDDLHPRPDDGDAYARVNALNDMVSSAGLVGDLRQCTVVASRSIGELRGRDFELALGLLEPRDGEHTYSASQITQMLAAAGAERPEVLSFAQRAVARLEKIGDLMRERVGYSAAPDLQPLAAALKGIQSLMPQPAEAAPDAGGAEPIAASAGGGAMAGGAAAPRGAGLGTSIDTRADALRAIDMVCAFIERTEPSNPAPYFLKRARRLVDKNFIELVRELAPESLDQVARLMGVSPEEISSENQY